jgi:hypothetical protein
MSLLREPPAAARRGLQSANLRRPVSWESPMIQNQLGGIIARGINAWCKSATASFLSAALLVAFPAEAASPAPIKLAMFDFELEDFTDRPLSAGETPSDTEQLKRVTDEVRQLLAQSGRYSLIDVGGADAAAVKAHTLRDCNGCDANIALKLGAEQSFVGVVKRISRTEYTIRFQIRDATTGTVVATEDSGLRMGADYSWNRGAARLIKDRLLESQPRQ